MGNTNGQPPLPPGTWSEHLPPPPPRTRSDIYPLPPRTRSDMYPLPPRTRSDIYAPPPETTRRWAVRILLECILVLVLLPFLCVCVNKALQPNRVEHSPVVADPDQFVRHRHRVDVGSLPVVEVRVRLPDLVQHLKKNKILLAMIAHSTVRSSTWSQLHGQN